MPELKTCQSPRSAGHTTHGHTSTEILDGKRSSPTYSSWCAMKARCDLTGRENSDRYKDRGISYCERWKSFDEFLSDMGERPDGTTLDRWPNPSGDYEPGNCRWATPRQQARNTRRNVLTFETAVQVAEMRLKGVACRVIAELYGISESLPREIVKGRCWPDALQKAQENIEEATRIALLHP